MSWDERPEDERGQDELIAVFAALGGPLTDAEFMRLLGSDKYISVMVRLAALLLDGDTAAAYALVEDSLRPFQPELAGQVAGMSRLGDAHAGGSG